MGDNAALDTLGDGLEPLGADNPLGGEEDALGGDLPSLGDEPALDDPALGDSDILGGETAPADLSLEEAPSNELEGLGGDLPAVDTPVDENLGNSQQNFDKAIEELSGMPISGVAEAASVAAGSAAAQPPVDATAGASDLILDIPVDVSIVLGNAQFSVGRLMSLQPGEVVELNRQLGEPLDIVVNGRNIAKGELTAMEGDESQFGIRVTELVT